MPIDDPIRGQRRFIFPYSAPEGAVCLPRRPIFGDTR